MLLNDAQDMQAGDEVCYDRPKDFGDDPVRHRCGFLLLNKSRHKLVVYKITNTVNGKGYIGITSKGIRQRLSSHYSVAMRGSSWPLYRSIRKHGPESFSAEVLYEAVDWRELVTLERALIAEHGTFLGGGKGYNQTAGGQGTYGKRHSPETLAKIAAKILTPEAIAASAAKRRGLKRPDMTGENSTYHRCESVRNALRAATKAMVGEVRPWMVERNKKYRRITTEQVHALLLDDRPLSAIAADYGLSVPTVCTIGLGKTYADVVEAFYADNPGRREARLARFDEARHAPRPDRAGDNSWMRNPENARAHSEKLCGRKAPETVDSNKRRRSLTEEDIRKILADPRKPKQICVDYGLGQTIIHNIRSGKKYSDVVAKIRAEKNVSE